MDFTEKGIEVRNSVVNTNQSINNNDVYEELILRQLERISSKGGYRIYSALLAQSGTDAPVVISVLQNTLGFVPVWNYSDIGIYYSDNAEWRLTQNYRKISTFINCGNNVNNWNYSAKINITNEDPSIIITSFYSGVAADGVLSDEDLFYLTSIEIKIYN